MKVPYHLFKFEENSASFRVEVSFYKIDDIVYVKQLNIVIQKLAVERNPGFMASNCMCAFCEVCFRSNAFE